MRKIDTKILYKKIYDAVRKLNVFLAGDVKKAIYDAFEKEKGKGKIVLKNIIENIEIAEKRNIPLCQDTGMIIAFVEVGKNILIDGNIRDTIDRAVKDAYLDGFFRKSVVTEPFFHRENSKTNLPTIVYYDFVEGDSLEIKLLAKGFGSENCSRIFMMKPTATKDELVENIVSVVRNAGGAPCPPVIVGVGIGGTMDYAAVLSKKAFFRDLQSKNSDTEYAELEKELYTKINKLGIGAGGIGGDFTTLGVKIESYATHIAGMPVAVSINCWADRKITVKM